MAPVAGDSPPIDCGLTRRILTESRGDDVAHDALVDERRIDARALDSLANDERAELRRSEIGEASLKFSYRSAAAGDDDNIVERGHESSSPRIFRVLHYRCSGAQFASRRKCDDGPVNQ